VFALDEPYDEFTRFSVIRRAWGLDEAGLKRDHDGGSAVLVLPEPSYLYNTPAELAFRRRLCREFNDIRPSEIAELPPGRVAVELYTARVAAPNAGAACPLLPRLYMAQPVRAAQFRAHRFAGGLFGLASDPMGVVAVRVLLDGRPVADAKTGLNPDTAPPVPEFKDDPGYPALWFSYALPADALTVGEHRLSIRAVLRTGQTKDSAARTIYVN